MARYSHTVSVLLTPPNKKGAISIGAFFRSSESATLIWGALLLGLLSETAKPPLLFGGKSATIFEPKFFWPCGAMKKQNFQALR